LDRIMRPSIKYPAHGKFSCPILQYEDDTLIILQVDLGNERHLNEVMEDSRRQRG